MSRRPSLDAETLPPVPRRSVPPPSEDVFSTPAGWGTVTLTPTQRAALRPRAFLGWGSYASVFAVDGDPSAVVKFTADPTDADGALRLLRRPVPEAAVRVYDVRRLRGQSATMNVHDARTGEWPLRTVPVHAVVAERVVPLPLGRRRWFSTAADVLKANEKRLPPPGPRWALPAPVRNELEDWCAMADAGPGREACLGDMARVEEVVTALARKAGFVPLDVHGGNWGTRAGEDRPVLLDFGVSLPGGKPPGRAKMLAGLGRSSMDGRWVAAGVVFLGLLLLGRRSKAQTRPGPAPDGDFSDTVPPPPPATAGGWPRHTVPVGGWSTLAKAAYGDWRWWPFLWDLARMESEAAFAAYGAPDRVPAGASVPVPASPPLDFDYADVVFRRAQQHEAWLARGGRGVPPAGIVGTTPLPSGWRWSGPGLSGCR